MAANRKTIENIVKILSEECDSQETVITIVRRLKAETVPSGNNSYDLTIQRLVGVVCG